MTRKSEKFIVADNKEEKNINNLFESATNNNHSLLNQLILLPKILRKILSSLSNIFKANTSLLLESFSNSANKKDISKSPNILQSDDISNKFKNSY